MMFCRTKNSIALLKPYSYLQAPGLIEAAEIESWKTRRCPASLSRISIILRYVVLDSPRSVNTDLLKASTPC